MLSPSRNFGDAGDVVTETARRLLNTLQMLADGCRRCSLVFLVLSLGLSVARGSPVASLCVDAWHGCFWVVGLWLALLVELWGCSEILRKRG